STAELESQNRIGNAVITRKSGVWPVMPNCVVILSIVRFQSNVLKPTSTLLNTRANDPCTENRDQKNERPPQRRPELPQVFSI
ncbi:MAG: hypothetical protein WAK04_18935, partial [Xanthobacteraceae bacterium]